MLNKTDITTNHKVKIDKIVTKKVNNLSLYGILIGLMKSIFLIDV